MTENKYHSCMLMNTSGLRSRVEIDSEFVENVITVMKGFRWPPQVCWFEIQWCE